MGLWNRLAYQILLPCESTSPDWPLMKRLWLRGNPTCACCGSATRPHVHFLEPLSYEAFEACILPDADDLVTLCMGHNECHLELGHGGSFRYHNPELDIALRALREHGRQVWCDVVARARDARVLL